MPILDTIFFSISLSIFVLCILTALVCAIAIYVKKSKGTLNIHSSGFKQFTFLDLISFFMLVVSVFFVKYYFVFPIWFLLELCVLTIRYRLYKKSLTKR